MSGGVHGLGPWDMAWGEIRARRGVSLVEVSWCRVAVTTLEFGCSCIVFIS